MNSYILYKNNYKINKHFSGKCTASKYTVHGFIDRNIIELFFNEDENKYSLLLQQIYFSLQVEIKLIKYNLNIIHLIIKVLMKYRMQDKY